MDAMHVSFRMECSKKVVRTNGFPRRQNNITSNRGTTELSKSEASISGPLEPTTLNREREKLRLRTSDNTANSGRQKQLFPKDGKVLWYGTIPSQEKMRPPSKALFRVNSKQGKTVKSENKLRRSYPCILTVVEGLLPYKRDDPLFDVSLELY